MPNTATRSSPSTSGNCCKVGISARQGSHQLAQKLSTSTRPLKSASDKRRPAMSSTSSGGVGWRAGHSVR